MGFFDRLYYGKAGKRDYTEMDMPKTRVSLFFLVLKDHFFDLVKVNLLQVVFWIPFLLWTYMSVAALQNIDAEAMITAENGSAQRCRGNDHPCPLPESPRAAGRGGEVCASGRNP